MIKLDSVSEPNKQREGYTFHCDNCGLYLDGIVAYKSPVIDALTHFNYCPFCGIETKIKEGQMTMSKEQNREREKLIKILENGMYEALSKINGEDKDKKCCDFLADHLLANGVIVPPVKVGDKVYTYLSELRLLIDEHEVLEVSTQRIWIDSNWYDYDDIGKTVFLSREEAKTAAEKYFKEKG